MAKKYPRIGSTIKKTTNTQAKCKCGAIAKFLTEVEVNSMRGDDDHYWSCAEHKKDLPFLLGKKS